MNKEIVRGISEVKFFVFSYRVRFICCKVLIVKVFDFMYLFLFLMLFVFCNGD